MRKANVNGLLVWKDENVRFLTSLRAQLIAGKTMALNGALLQPDGDPVLLCSGGEIDKVREGMSWIGEAHAIPIMEQAELVDGFVRDILRPILVNRKLDSGKLGVDAANISFIDSLRRHLPDVELVDGDVLMQKSRLIKSDIEVDIIEESCAIGDAVTQRALDGSKAGKRELEIAGDAMQTLFHLGGEMAHVVTPFVASGEHMSPPHRLATDKLTRNMDLVLHRYRCHVERLFRRHRAHHHHREAVEGPAEDLHRGVRGSHGRGRQDAPWVHQSGRGRRHRQQDRRPRFGRAHVQPFHRPRHRNGCKRAALHR